jgi:hypothetical protein
MSWRHFVYVGSVECDAFLVDPQIAGEARARARIVAAWRPGTSVHRSALGWIVRSASPARVMANAAMGLPLVARTVGASTVLCSAPLEDDEIRALDAAGDGDVIVVHGGEPRVIDVARSESLDVASWLVLPEPRVVRVESLGEPAEQVALTPIDDSRALFDPVVGETSAEIRAMQEAIVSRSAPAGTSLLGRMLAGMKNALRDLRRVTRGNELAVTTATPGSSLFERIISAVRSMIARALLRASLARFFARQQAEYIGDTLDMLDRGDYEEALKRAIPLGSGTGEDAPFAFGLPPRRDALSISASTTRATSSVLVDAHELLRRAYRAAFERLARLGRIDEAAFVLAELLRANEEAVSFLEEHGRLELAAQIAEARGLPPDLVVRQWFIAGDIDRAVRHAKLHGAFAGALVRLERTGRKREADALRLSWAGSLAEKGDYVGAVDVAWTLASATAFVREWIALAMMQGGETGATMIGRSVVLEARVTPNLRAAVLDVLDDASREGPYRRVAFARVLAEARSSNDGMRVCARAAVRALYTDAPLEGLDRLIPKLVALANDGALRADEPHLATPARRVFSVTAPRVIRASRRGTTRVHDAAIGKRDRLIAALGESGVRVLSREGRVMASFGEPAHALSVSDELDRVVVVADRGEALRLSRIDVTRRRSERWCDARLGNVCATFDGWTLVATDSAQDVLVVDATHSGVRVMRRLKHGGHVVATARGPKSCVFMIFPLDSISSLEIWYVELPSWTLRRRSPIALEQVPRVISLHENGGHAFAFEKNVAYDAGAGLTAMVDVAGVGDVLVADGFVATARSVPDGVMVGVTPWGHARIDDVLLLEGATRAKLRRTADRTFVVFDDQGRVFWMDSVTGHARAEWLV